MAVFEGGKTALPTTTTTITTTTKTTATTINEQRGGLVASDLQPQCMLLKIFQGR